MIKYSFIIPVKEINDYIRQSVPRILEIERNDYEVIVCTDEFEPSTGAINKDNNRDNECWYDDDGRVLLIASGAVGPATKRNLAAGRARGDILVFVDDDAYPDKKFLDILDSDFAGDFKNEKIAAVGGPALTPAENNFWQKVSGAVFLSSCSHSHPERYAPLGEKKLVDDWPSVNLSVRKAAFEKAGGFKSEYWPGEDTKFCLDLLEKCEGGILYNPGLVVWHHRREGLARHLKQVGNYGLHRGFFAKKYPATSRKFVYFIPSAFLCFVFFGAALSFYSNIFLNLYLAGWGVYLLVLIKAFFDILSREKTETFFRRVFIALNAIYYIVLTHLFYGLKFIQGFIFTRELKSKLR